MDTAARHAGELDRPAPRPATPPASGAGAASLAATARDAAYRAMLAVLAGWALARHRRRFAEVERFCLFVGYPRSGHSIVGAMLDAHPDAVIAHELDVPPLVLAGCARDALYARILARATWFHLRGNRTHYDYAIARQHQGRFRRLRVVGDKRGGAVARALATHPDLLDRLRRLTGVPLRLVHVVRNPFDNVAAISLWHGLSLEASIAYYFEHAAVTAALGELADPSERLTLRHEELLAAPAEGLRALAAFVGVEPAPDWMDACRRALFRAPTQTRRRVEWSPDLRREVAHRAAKHPDLGGYTFDGD